MAQWLDLPNGVKNKIYQFIDNDSWKLYNLSSVNRNWWMTDLEVPRRQLGTIVLTPCGTRYRYYERAWGTTIVTLVKLTHHSMEYNISPNQYSCLGTVTNIRQYKPI